MENLTLKQYLVHEAKFFAVVAAMIVAAHVVVSLVVLQSPFILNLASLVSK